MSKELVDIAAQTLALNRISLTEKAVVMVLGVAQLPDALIQLDRMDKELLPDYQHPLLKAVQYLVYQRGQVEPRIELSTE